MEGDKKYVTLDEANAQVASLRALFGRVMQLRALLKDLYARLEDSGHAPTQEELDAGDWDPDDLPPEARRHRALFDGLVESLQDQVDEIQDTGCIIKDIETGLVDWYSIHNGREVFLCWQYGETTVSHWHEVDSGFDGRKPLSEP